MEYKVSDVSVATAQAAVVGILLCFAQMDFTAVEKL